MRWVWTGGGARLGRLLAAGLLVATTPTGCEGSSGEFGHDRSGEFGPSRSAEPGVDLGGEWGSERARWMRVFLHWQQICRQRGYLPEECPQPPQPDQWPNGEPPEFPYDAYPPRGGPSNEGS
jgi:hypothetical protein